jgi:hypothetical protein
MLQCNTTIYKDAQFMTRDEYEASRQRIEEQTRIGVDLLQAAGQAQLRALEVLWLTTSGEPVRLTPSPSTLERPSAPPSTPAEPRRSLGRVYQDLMKVLPELPETFDRNDVCRALGYKPDRTALYRILNELVRDGKLRVSRRGEGRKPAKYTRSG